MNDRHRIYEIHASTPVYDLQHPLIGM